MGKFTLKTLILAGAAIAGLGAVTLPQTASAAQVTARVIIGSGYDRDDRGYYQTWGRDYRVRDHDGYFDSWGFWHNRDGWWYDRDGRWHDRRDDGWRHYDARRGWGDRYDRHDRWDDRHDRRWDRRDDRWDRRDDRRDDRHDRRDDRRDDRRGW